MTSPSAGLASSTAPAGQRVASAIVVNAGVQRLYIHDVEIINWPADGIHFDGAITDLKLIDNYIHNNSGHGVAFATTPGGVAQLYGNSFRNNGGAGVSALTPSSVTATYNEWGSYDGPNTGGDGTAGTVTSTPWTFGKVFADAVPPSPVYIREGLTVDVDIKVDGHEPMAHKSPPPSIPTISRSSASPTPAPATCRAHRVAPSHSITQPARSPTTAPAAAWTER